MKIKEYILVAILLTLLQAIYLPLQSNRPRCMMVYTIGDVQTVKIFLNLPQIPHHTRSQYYEFTMRNTQTQKVQNQTLEHGSINRQFDLTPNVIYEVCITVISDRDLQDITVYYKAETVYNIEHTQLKVPQNLLKKQDFKTTYQAAYHIQSTVEQYQIMQKERDITSNQHFTSTKEVDKNLITISIIEILIVVAAGIYQFISLKNYLVTKQYI